MNRGNKFWICSTTKAAVSRYADWQYQTRRELQIGSLVSSLSSCVVSNPLQKTSLLVQILHYLLVQLLLHLFFLLLLCLNSVFPSQKSLQISPRILLHLVLSSLHIISYFATLRVSMFYPSSHLQLLILMPSSVVLASRALLSWSTVEFSSL